MREFRETSIYPQTQRLPRVLILMAGSADDLQIPNRIFPRQTSAPVLQVMNLQFREIPASFTSAASCCKYLLSLGTPARITKTCRVVHVPRAS